MRKKGYHSTSEEIGNDILIQKRFIDSDETNWLGRGVYFWGDCDIFNGFDASIWWITKIKRLTKYIILKVEIQSDKYLDLIDNITHKRIFGNIKNELIEKHFQSGRNEIDFKEYLIFKFIDQKYNYDFIYAFTHGSDSRYRKIGFNLNVVTRPQIQICVKKQDCIMSITRMEIE